MKDLEHYKNEAERYRGLFSYKAQDVNTRAAIKEDQRLYRKVGKKFTPVNDPYAYDGLRNGSWLIQIKDGCTSIRQEIYPDKAPIHAAARLMEEQLVEIIRKGRFFPQKRRKIGISLLRNTASLLTCFIILLCKRMQRKSLRFFWERKANERTSHRGAP